MKFQIIVFFFCSLLLSNNLIAQKGKNTLPKDPAKAAALFNEAFASTFKKVQLKASPNNMRSVNKSEFLKLVKTHKNISKDHYLQLEKDLQEWRELNVLIMELKNKNICEGQANFLAVVEAGMYQTDIKWVFTTCGYLRCIFFGYNEDERRYECDPFSGDLKTVKLCTESSRICCANFYCLEQTCPHDTCSENMDCSTCN